MLLSMLTMLAVVVILVGFNALYVAGEFSTVGARKSRVMRMAQEGNRLAASLLTVLSDHHRLDNYIAASQVGITVSSVVLGIYGQQQIAPRLEPLIALLPLERFGAAADAAAASGIAAAGVLLVLTTFQVVMGELLPKSLALQFPERVALLTTLPMRWSADFLFKPLILILNGSGRLLLRLLGVEAQGEHTHVHSPEEIAILFSESHQGGLIDADERQLLRGVFRSAETTALEIAVPRPLMVSASIDDPIEEVLRTAAGSAYSRIPIYQEDEDHIIGFVHLKDLFLLYRENPGGSVRAVLRPIPYVPESLGVPDLWERLNQEGSYLAVVFDEYGGTAGLVTREDVIEELFGEFQDEFDRERAPIMRIGPASFTVRGDTAILQINDELELDLPQRDTHSIAGFIMEELGRLPVPGDEVTFEGTVLRVQAVRNMTASSVRISFPPDHPLALRKGGR